LRQVANLTQVIVTKSKQNLASNLPKYLLHNPVNGNNFLLSPIGTAHLLNYMRRAYGTHLIFLTNFRRIEIRRYNMSRPEGTFNFLIAQVGFIRTRKPLSL
jgi:hypothetical protein